MEFKLLQEDEIVSIEYIGEEDTIDINVSGNRLFYANNILTHNSAVEEVEFDHSHISGGLSKIMTADNVIGIFTSRAMKERGRFQIQFMKTRSSSGVDQKVDLEFNIETLRISDLGDEEDNSSFNQGGGRSPGPTPNGTTATINSFKKTSTVRETIDADTGEIRSDDPTQGKPVGKIKGATAPPLVRKLLAGLNPEKD